jgi:hypothetical protein
MSIYEQVNFIFRLQPKKNSKYGVLLTYMNEDESELPRHERMLNPISAFWLPFAYQQCTTASHKEIQQLARSAVYQLKLHIQYIEDSFGLQTSSISLEETQSHSQGLFSNDWHEKDYLEATEDFSQEDDILNQIN